MRQVVVRPAGVVLLPDGVSLPIATVPGLRHAVAASLAAPPAPAPAFRPLPVAPPALPRRPVTVRGVAQVEETVAIAATSVGIVPAAGTLVTSTPANLLAGPEADITDFTIVSLDSGTW